MPPEIRRHFARAFKESIRHPLTLVANKTKCASAFTFRPPRERALRDYTYAREGQKRFR